MKITKKIVSVPIIFLFTWLGCRVIPSSLSLSEAHQKFLKICQDEYHLSVVLKPLQNTVWIYVPIDQSILELKATKEESKTPGEVSKKPTIRFVDGKYVPDNFHIEYDIGSQISYPQNFGYNTSQSPTYIQIQNHILTAISRAYFDVGTVPGDVEYLDGDKDATHKKLVESYVKTDRPPDFFVVVVADVVRGVEKKDIFYLQDYKRSYTGEVPMEELWKRFISEYKGSEKIIGDKEGRYLDYKNITLPDFLIKQIVQRIKIKYQQSSLPPSENAREEILSIISDTLLAYKFTDYKGITLHDLVDGATYSAGK